MRVTLLQDDIYVPVMGGGIKANRCLLEELARSGHTCSVIARARTLSPDGPRTRDEFLQELTNRRIDFEQVAEKRFDFTVNSVRVHAIDDDELTQRAAACSECVREAAPDYVIVADDKRRYMLPCALAAAPERVVLLLQTIVQMPFGPLSVNPDPAYFELMRKTRAFVVISEFEQTYVREHGGMSSSVVHLPVYGRGPFANLAKSDGFVTMINPCNFKGLPIFVELVKSFPQVSFAAVPTWGANDEIMAQLQQFPNLTLLARADDIEHILAQTRVLVAPSVWPETFGYVVPEAMLRGIPVIASRIGGLPEAKLGVDYLVEVTPGEWQDGQFIVPPQNDKAWADALNALVNDPAEYQRCSVASRAAAERFVNQVSAEKFVEVLSPTE
ncbi:MAG: glycosyltransferase family 4 protein [Planctomycetales bacterium]|nr:glycosyltransferase family 4 protein [Planctomycetales bacterium]MCA9168285.1 glycosyltransferase family 4 protein [Planctomycetales bacterium]